MQFKIGNKLLNWIFLLIKNQELRSYLLKALPFWIAALLAGLAAVIYARLFALAESYWISLYHQSRWSLFLVTPLCFILSWALVRKFSPFAGGSGIPQVMASIELSSAKGNPVLRNLLGLRVILVKFLSSLVMLCGGGAIGREGPTIQIAGSIFRKINEILPIKWPRISERNMIVSGAAAGLAAAFNSPLAGIIFAIEELSKIHFNDFKIHIFSGVIIAGFTVQTLIGYYLYIGIPNVTGYPFSTHFGVIVVAIVAGLLSGITAKAMLYFVNWKNKFRKIRDHLIYLLVGALIMVSLAIFINSGILGSGRSILTSTLLSDNKHLPWFMPLFRMLGSVISFSTGASGGIFAPGLSCGASCGAVYSEWFGLNPSETNIMILVGMVSFLTGLTRAPFTSAVVVLEMTDSNNLILFFMLGAIVANISAMVFDRHSIYEHLKDQYITEIQSKGSE